MILYNGNCRITPILKQQRKILNLSALKILVKEHALLTFFPLLF